MNKQVLAERSEVKHDKTRMEKAILKNTEWRVDTLKATGHPIRSQTGPRLSFFVWNLVSKYISLRSLGYYLGFFFFLKV